MIDKAIDIHTCISDSFLEGCVKNIVYLFHFANGRAARFIELNLIDVILTLFSDNYSMFSFFYVATASI